MLQKKNFHINSRPFSEHELVQNDYYSIFKRDKNFQTVDRKHYKILKI